MDILKDDPLEFLDFTGLEESEKNEVLYSLQSTDSNLQLPWIITRNVPSPRQQQSKTIDKTKPETNPMNTVDRNHVGDHQHPSLPPSGAFISRPFEPNQFQSSVFHQIPTNFPVSPVPYPAYPPGVLHVTPIYTTFPQNIRNSSNSSSIISPIIYSPEPTYNYAQVSPVPVNFENSRYEQMSNYTHHNGIPVNLETNNISPATHMNQKKCEVDDYSSTENMLSHNNFVNSNASGDESAAAAAVSYGVPASLPFPLSNPTKIPSPSLDVSETFEYEKQTADKLKNGMSNGHNGVIENKNDGAAAKNKSWASLFKGAPDSMNVSNSSMTNQMNQKIEIREDESPIKNPKKNQFIDPTCYRMGEFLSNHSVDGKTISLQPRGLINRSNYCYINSILQALLACPPLYNLLSGLSKAMGNSSEKRKETPFIDSMCKLVNEFEHLAAGQRVGRRNEKNQKKEAVSINCGNPFEPSWIYKMLNGMRSDSFLVEGRQEDAEEFFGCLLNGLNDEIQELMKLVSNDVEENKVDVIQHDEEENDNWQIMGPKNKSSITRQTVFGKTPISNIFGGLLRSKIHRTGDESTNNIQPFFTLQLNIEKAKSVSEALDVLVSKNQLEGVTSSKTNEQVEAWQQVMIEELPVVLVLHLKCFDYQLNGCTKIMKSLEFPIDLKIDSKLLSSKIISSKEKQYKLFAVVYHDGKEASKGHYLTDAFHVGYNSWLRYDDASIKTVSEEQVLSPKGSRVPYLLFYRRSDTIRSK